jgi:catabolite regulation protein CreA
MVISFIINKKLKLKKDKYYTNQVLKSELSTIWKNAIVPRLFDIKTRYK